MKTICVLIFLSVLTVTLACCGNGGHEASGDAGTPPSTPVASTISGRITMAGEGLPDVVVELTGTINAVTRTDAQGNYRFEGLSDGSYTLTPSGTDMYFEPQQRTVTTRYEPRRPGLFRHSPFFSLLRRYRHRLF